VAAALNALDANWTAGYVTPSSDTSYARVALRPPLPLPLPSPSPSTFPSTEARDDREDTEAFARVFIISPRTRRCIYLNAGYSATRDCTKVRTTMCPAPHGHAAGCKGAPLHPSPTSEPRDVPCPRRRRRTTPCCIRRRPQRRLRRPASQARASAWSPCSP